MSKKGFARLSDVERRVGRQWREWIADTWDWLLVIVLAIAIFVIGTCVTGCAANRVAFQEAHWYPSGLPKSTVSLHQMQLVTAGSKLQDGSNIFTRLDDTSFESGNKATGIEASGDPVEVIRAAMPLLELLATPVPVASQPNAIARLLNLLSVIQGGAR